MEGRTFAIVDIETTGTSGLYDRIIEIGIVRIENGTCVKTFSSLVNPEQSISPTIQGITGISPNDLITAPTFADITGQVKELLADAIFVAHNVRFDYSFIKNEFKRLEDPYNAKNLCTVRLSRKLFPTQPSHNLDAVIKKHKLKCENRHRAYDDADVLWQFLQKIHKKDPDLLSRAISDLLSEKSLPPFLDEKTVRNLPEGCGVYTFYGPDDELLYVGKSKNLRYRILSHFSNDHRDNKEMNLTQQVVRVDTEETVGELGALLLESSLVKALSPIYNKRLRKRKELVRAKGTIIDGFIHVTLEHIDTITPKEHESTLGIFRTLTQAKTFLKETAREHNLCSKFLGTEKTKSGCFSQQLGTCFGACIGKEHFASYNKRLEKAFGQRRIKTWPFKGPLMIEEKKSETEKHAFILDNWALVADIRFDGDETEAVTFTPEFDYDSYKLFSRYLSSPLNKRAIKKLTYRELSQILHQETEDLPVIY